MPKFDEFKFENNKTINNELLEAIKNIAPHLFNDGELNFESLKDDLNIDESISLRERERERVMDSLELAKTMLKN